MKQTILLLAAIGVSIAPLSAQTNQAAAPLKLDPILQRADLWGLTGQVVLGDYRPLGFRWVSDAKQAVESTRDGISLLGSPVAGSILRFDGDSLANITVLIYSRGDDGDRDKAEFSKMRGDWIAAISNFVGSEARMRGKDASSAVRAEGVEWSTGNADVLLEYSYTREVKSRNIPFRAEFMRLEITPKQAQKSLLAGSFAQRDDRKKKFSGRDHITRDSNGDIYIADVPMVDQGQKGYCVVAAAERLMRYFGTEADQHELAQIANSSADKGTSVDAMLESLKELTPRLRLKVRTVEEFDIKAVLDLIKDYNRLARRRDVPEIQHGQMIDVQEIYTSMDPKVLEEARTKNSASMNKFMRRVQTKVDAGIPLLWSVMLGVVPEPEIPQANGGHMRLIIGYNAKTNEIIYSDTWGRGHEKKRMALTKAYTVTTSLSTVEPL